MNLINVIEFYESQNLDIFDGIVLPDGLDKDIVVNTILDISATYIPLYTDYNLFNMKNKVFFQRNLNNFTLMYQALKEEYNPIHNYDRYEDRDEERNINEENGRNIDDTVTRDLFTENQVSAFDTNEYQKQSRILDQGNETTKTSDNYNSNSNDMYRTRNHLYGNIGVTTSQQMLESEIDLRKKYNIYEIIARMWYNEFMIRVEEVWI